MLLALDAGNSHITLGLYQEAELRAHWRVRADRERTADEYGILLRGLLAAEGLETAPLAGVAVSNVVAPLTAVLAECCRRYLGAEPEFAGRELPPGIAVRYRAPEELGADRLVNAVAVQRRYGGPAVVIDFGTATTFDALSDAGEFLGGAIAPGIGISMEVLFRAAPRLGGVTLARPPSVVGRTTEECLQSGILHGFAAQTEGMVRRLRAVVGGEARVVATGGLAAIVAAETAVIDVVDPFLTLEGLRILWYEHHSSR